MEESKLSQAESLQIITNMIQQAKRNIARDGSFYFLLWGWVVMIANFGHFLIDKFTQYPAPYAVWLISIPAVVITVIYSIRRRQRSGVSGQLDKVYGHLWTSIFVVLVTVLAFMNKINFQHNAVILLLAGLGTYVSGRLLRFVPLVLGGVALWVGALVAFNVSVVDQTLVGGVAITLGYLIPGYLLRRAERG